MRESKLHADTCPATDVGEKELRTSAWIDNNVSRLVLKVIAKVAANAISNGQSALLMHEDMVNGWMSGLQYNQDKKSRVHFYLVLDYVINRMK